MTLYVSNNGEVACGKNARHGGAYLATQVVKSPEKARIETPITTWFQVPEDMEEEFGLICEACEQEAKYTRSESHA